VAFGNQGRQAGGILRKAPAMVAGELVFAVGHEGGLVRAHAADEVHQVLRWVAFDVVLALGPGLQQFGELVHVVGPDVALIGPGCTVMPCAPACRHSSAARVTLGMPRWRVLRTSATLLTLTDSAVRGWGEEVIAIAGPS
jgi:hypothetical protein